MGNRVQVALLVSWVGATGCQQYQDPEVPELETPLCGQLSDEEVQASLNPENDTPDIFPAIAGTGEGDAWAPMTGDPPLCPIFNTWRAMTCVFAPKIQGLAPRNVQVLLTWELEDRTMGEQLFTADLVCPTPGDPRPLVLGVSMFESFETARPGSVLVKAAADGHSPDECGDVTSLDEGCVVIEQDVLYRMAE